MPCLKLCGTDILSRNKASPPTNASCSKTTLVLCYMRGTVWHPEVSGKKIRVGYYFIKKRISTGDIVVKHCPTRAMRADNFTTPLQGALFQKFRTEIQGIPDTRMDEEMCWDAPGPFNMSPKTTNTATRKPIPQECVGEELNYDLRMYTSQIIEDEKVLGNTCCRSRVRTLAANFRNV